MVVKVPVITNLHYMINAKLSQQRFLALAQERICHAYSNNTPQPVCQFQTGFPSLWLRVIKVNPDHQQREAVLKHMLTGCWVWWELP